MLSDLISERDSLELDINRILNNETKPTIHKKIDFDNLLGKISETNSKINMLSEYMGSLNNDENNNKN
jgi:hypothetical protein